MKGLDARLGALERVYGVDDGPPIIVVINASGAGEADVQAAIRQALEHGPGEPTFLGGRLYVVRVARPEVQGEP